MTDTYEYLVHVRRQELMHEAQIARLTRCHRRPARGDAPAGVPALTPDPRAGTRRWPSRSEHETRRDRRSDPGGRRERSAAAAAPVPQEFR
jgi:hypothetical protein